MKSAKCPVRPALVITPYPGASAAQAESNLKNTEAAIPALEIGLRLALNRLAVLLGEPPGALDEELGESREIPEPPADLVVGVPAELLRQRPDLRSAKRRLAAQTARIGIATADLYPRFSLSGFFAVQTTEAGDLLDGDSTTWGISLPFRWNLFAGGRIRSAIEVEEALTASQRTVELAEIQYRAGLTDFQNVLDSQRFLAQQQDFFASSEGQMVQSLIGLYKALGGGWDPDSAEAPEAEGESGADSGS
jgi:outer membrane protein TolC